VTVGRLEIERLRLMLAKARGEQLELAIERDLDCEPRRWKIIEHVREKFSCRDCEVITEATAPQRHVLAAEGHLIDRRLT
jgi:transposase